MGKWKIVFTKNADSDSVKIDKSGLKPKVIELINILKDNPFTRYPAFEKLSGDLEGMYSRRINKQHRLVYEVYKKEKTVRILAMWTHYE